MDSLFGTDGIRAAMGTSFFTHQTLPIIAHALSAWTVDTYARGNRNPRVALIHDTRNSCSYIKSVLNSHFFLHSIDVFDAGVLPTPGAWYLLQQHDYDYVIIISASHNHWHDNGIKIMDRSGKLNAQAERIIMEYINHPPALTYNYHQLGTLTTVAGTDLYREALTALFPADFLRGYTVVLDCAHGATSSVAPEIFKAYGATVITLHDQPTGFNINHESGALHTQALQKKVVACRADMGFAFDGDGDRVMAVNRAGALKNGDDILALLSMHPDYAAQQLIVGTIMSNIGLQMWFEQQHKKLIRTPVGDKYVTQALQEHNVLLGGEQSGHIVLKNYTHTGDGILVALKSAHTLMLTNNENFETFTPFPQILLTIPVQKMCNLSESPYNQLIQEAQSRIPSGRISVRYSGTEKNMLRIMVEAELQQEAHTIAHTLALSLQKELT